MDIVEQKSFNASFDNNKINVDMGQTFSKSVHNQQQCSGKTFKKMTINVDSAWLLATAPDYAGKTKRNKAP